MSKADGTAGFFRRRFARVPVAGTDWGDLGTAFGLDMSLAAPLPPAQAEPASVRLPPTWLQRMTARARRR